MVKFPWEIESSPARKAFRDLLKRSGSGINGRLKSATHRSLRRPWTRPPTHPTGQVSDPLFRGALRRLPDDPSIPQAPSATERSDNFALKEPFGSDFWHHYHQANCHSAWVNIRFSSVIQLTVATHLD
jgi:hypothetical protein